MDMPEPAGHAEATPAAQIAPWAEELISRVAEDYLGNREAIELCLAALLCRGHVLIEDLPGVGKTVLARSLARAVGGAYRQIQCTPDLLPADILGVSVYDEASESFRFHSGPIMTNTLLVDEINRATPRTQSALLEAMAEGQVSVESRTMPLPHPFFLVATESPLESEGTFPLPEVQKDRFFLTLTLGYPPRDQERLIMADWSHQTDRGDEVSEGRQGEVVEQMQELVTKIFVSEGIKDYVVSLVRRTRSDRRLTVGVSPRGSLALFKGSQALAAIAGRGWVVPEDVKRIGPSVLKARVLIKPQFAARGLTATGVVEELLATVELPGYGQEGTS